MFALYQAVADDGLTIGEVLSDIPHDAAAVFVYVLVMVFVGFIWYGSRKKPG